MTHDKIHSVVPFALCIAMVFVTTGCRDLRSFKEVEKAFENPSGRLDEATAPTVLNVSLLGQETDGANRLATDHADVPGDVETAVDFLLASSEGGLGTAQQALFECTPHVKFRANMAGLDKITFDCGDTGDVTGRLTLDLDWKGDELRGFFLDYEMFCEHSRCIDGSMGARWSLDAAPGSGLKTSLIATARFSVIVGGSTYHVDWAWRFVADDEEARFEWVVWTSPDRSGESFVLAAVANASGGYLEIRDADGWWRCEYGEEAMEGECFRCTPEGNECVPVEGGDVFSWSTGTS